MHVAGILNDKGNAVVTMGPRSTVKEAIALMAQRRIGAVVVVGVEHSVLGMFSERDVVRVLAQKGPEALTDDLARHMTSPVFTCTPQTLIDEIMHLMTSKKFRHVPVVDGGALSEAGFHRRCRQIPSRRDRDEHKAMRDYSPARDGVGSGWSLRHRSSATRGLIEKGDRPRAGEATLRLARGPVRLWRTAYAVRWRARKLFSAISTISWICGSTRSIDFRPAAIAAAARWNRRARARQAGARR